MSWWDRFVAIFKSEAADVKEGLQKAGQTISDELDRKQAELDAEPHERIDMLMEESEQADAAFDELEQRIKGESESD